MKLLIAMLLLAQSQQFIEPSKAVQEACFAQGRSINQLYWAKRSGMSLQEAIDLIPAEWSQEMRIDAAHGAAQVWALEGAALKAWFEGVMQRCMESGGHGTP